MSRAWDGLVSWLFDKLIEERGIYVYVYVYVYVYGNSKKREWKRRMKKREGLIDRERGLLGRVGDFD
jgi:hypothetical protein